MQPCKRNSQECPRVPMKTACLCRCVPCAAGLCVQLLQQTPAPRPAAARLRPSPPRAKPARGPPCALSDQVRSLASDAAVGLLHPRPRPPPHHRMSAPRGAAPGRDRAVRGRGHGRRVALSPRASRPGGAGGGRAGALDDGGDARRPGERFMRFLVCRTQRRCAGGLLRHRRRRPATAGELAAARAREATLTEDLAAKPTSEVTGAERGPGAGAHVGRWGGAGGGVWRGGGEEGLGRRP